MESEWKEPTPPRSNPIRLGDVVTYARDDGRVGIGMFVGRRQYPDGRDEARLSAPIAGGGCIEFTMPFDRLTFEGTGWNADTIAKLDRYRNEEVQ